MAKITLKYREAVMDKDNNVIVIHRETDTDCVFMPDGIQTLSQFLMPLAGYRAIHLSGAVTGAISFGIMADGIHELETEITDDSHGHSGSTVIMSAADRVIVSSAEHNLVVSEITTDELNCLKGIKSNVQDQLDDLSRRISELEEKLSQQS